MEKNSQFLETLIAHGPAVEQDAAMQLFGQFIGSWAGRARTRNYQVNEYGEVYFDTGDVYREASLEVHFGWVLQGRAIQDVWISPAQKDIQNPSDVRMYGTTLRVYNAHQQCWYNTFIDPVTTQSIYRMKVYDTGNDIVQEFTTRSGKICQWIFADISTAFFHWMWRESTDEGITWDVPAEFFVYRK